MSAWSPSRNLAVAGTFAVSVLLIDKLTKDWAWETLRDAAPLKVLPGRFHLDFAFNTGSAFGLAASQPWARSVFSALATLVIIGLFALLWRVRPRHPLAAIGVGLSAGGAAGNLLDRLTRVLEVRSYGFKDAHFHEIVAHADRFSEAVAQGRHWVEIPRQGVVDFIVFFYAPFRRWPAFNVADIALTLGALALIAWVWREDESVFGGGEDGSD